jgi:predicted phage terminase large subunit-like protein
VEPTSEQLEQIRATMIEKALADPFATLIALGGPSLFQFIEAFWNEIIQDEFKPNWHIRYLCEELEKIAERVGSHQKKLHDLIINIPPGTTKTTICSVMFPVWCWTKWPWMKFITGSYSSDLSLESADKSRDLMRSKKFKLLYPDIFIKEDKDTKSNYKIGIRQRDARGRSTGVVLGGGRFSTSIGGTIMGFHGHINIWDDPLNPKQAASETLINTANNWVDHSASTRKVDKDISTTILVMQRIHQNDPSGHLLEKSGKEIKHICLPGEIRNYKKFLNPPELVKYYKDDLLDPVRLSWKALKEMEADLGQYAFAGQVGQNPVPPGGGMFKVENFRIIDTMPSTVHVVQIIRYWDKAATENAGKRTAGVKIAKLRNNTYVVMDVQKGQWASEKRERIIRATAESDTNEVEIYIEQEPGSGGKESAQSTIRNLAGFFAGKDRPTGSDGDKVKRADTFSVQVNEGNVMLLRGEWNRDFIEEYRFFPFGRFKDQVDAGSACFNLLASKLVVERLT